MNEFLRDVKKKEKEKPVDYIAEITLTKIKLDTAYTQFIEGAIFASEFQQYVIYLSSLVNSYMVNEDIEHVSNSLDSRVDVIRD